MKGKLARAVADELGSILLRNTKYRDQMTAGIAAFLASSDSQKKLKRIREIEGLLSDSQLRIVLEDCALNDAEKDELATTIGRVGAFPSIEVDAVGDVFPF